MKLRINGFDEVVAEVVVDEPLDPLLEDGDDDVAAVELLELDEPPVDDDDDVVELDVLAPEEVPEDDFFFDVPVFLVELDGSLPDEPLVVEPELPELEPWVVPEEDDPPAPLPVA